jgi:hypothetical protein
MKPRAKPSFGTHLIRKYHQVSLTTSGTVMHVRRTQTIKGNPHCDSSCVDAV